MDEALVQQRNYQHSDCAWYYKKYCKKKYMEQTTWENQCEISAAVLNIEPLSAGSQCNFQTKKGWK